MTPTTDLPQPTPRQRNWAAWLGLLFALAAILSNAGFFLGLPGQKAIPWLGVVLTIAGIVCAIIGVMRAFRQPQVYGKVSSSILGAVSLLLCGLIAFGSFHSRDLPSSAAAPQVGQKAPDFTLADTNGNKISLGELLGKAGASALPNSATAGSIASGASSSAMAAPTKSVLLVFYRGYW